MDQIGHNPLAIRHSPNTGPVVLAGRHDLFSIGAELGISHRRFVEQRAPQRFTGSCIPDSSSAVIACGNDKLAIVAEDGEMNRPRVSFQDLELASLNVPYSRQALLTKVDNLVSVGAESSTEHCSWMLRQEVGFFQVGRVPDANCFVLARCDRGFAIRTPGGPAPTRLFPKGLGI